MAKYLMIIESCCKDPAREKEFNEWYSIVHIPDVSSQSGFVNVTRWVEFDLGQNRKNYIMLFEIETDDIDTLLTKEQENITLLKARNRLSDLFVLVSRRIFKRIVKDNCNIN